MFSNPGVAENVNDRVQNAMEDLARKAEKQKLSKEIADAAGESCCTHKENVLLFNIYYPFVHFFFVKVH